MKEIYDNEIMMVIFQGLKPTFDSIIQSMTVNNNIDSIDLDQVIDILVFEDERRNKGGRKKEYKGG